MPVFISGKLLKPKVRPLHGDFAVNLLEPTVIFSIIAEVHGREYKDARPVEKVLWITLLAYGLARTHFSIIVIG
jgi:hypothetical protein